MFTSTTSDSHNPNILITIWTVWPHFVQRKNLSGSPSLLVQISLMLDIYLHRLHVLATDGHGLPELWVKQLAPKQTHSFRTWLHAFQVGTEGRLGRVAWHNARYLIHPLSLPLSFLFPVSLSVLARFMLQEVCWHGTNSYHADQSL